MAFLTPHQATAQEITFSAVATESCLASTLPDEHERCIGQSAVECQESSDGGSTTYGMITCLNGEAKYWDTQLNETYGELMAFEEATDTELLQINATVPSKAEALRDMQRAWITFRDASCSYERSQFGNGTGAGPAGVSCFMRMTGKQTIFLRERLQHN
ncbi:hypothetical protein BWR17_19080 (plasmid) [Phaeobacter inhibens]|nr:hypothetical protein BWR17_19080 [Phaeobacter inhibens]